MSRFYVGQAVRIVGADDRFGRTVVGKEATIHCLNEFNETDPTCNIGVTIDGDDGWMFCPHHLEPIQRSDDKSQSSSDEMPADTLQVVSDLLSKIARVGEVANV